MEFGFQWLDVTRASSDITRIHNCLPSSLCNEHLTHDTPHIPRGRVERMRESFDEVPVELWGEVDQKGLDSR